MNKKYEIEIPGVPEGWKPVTVKPPRKDIDHILTREGVVLFRYDGYEPLLIVEKIKPRRIVLEETNEYFQKGQSGHYIDEHSRIVGFTESAADWHCTYKIWREVEEE